MLKEPLLQLRLPREAISKMGGLLSQGVRIPTRVGISLWDFLCDRLGLEPDYVQDRLQTVFINGRAIDRFDSVHIRNGDTIALSSAMPGLVGATLRRGGHLAGMRKEISYAPEQDLPRKQADGAVLLKLFNVVAREVGRQVLSEIVCVPSQTLLAGLNLLITAGHLPESGGIQWKGQPCELADFEDNAAQELWIAMQIVWR